MANTVIDPDSTQSTPAAAGAAKKENGSPLLVFLTVILILVGIIDVVLWGVVGYYALQSAQQNASLNGAAGSGEPAASGGDASDSTEKQAALIAYIQELTEIEPLEAETLESIASVSGTNFTDDETMYTEFTERSIPLCQQMNEKVLAIVPGDSEIEELCNMHQDYVTKMLNALTMMTSALSNQNAAQVAEANDQLNAANQLTADFHQALRSMAAERNVTLNN